MVTAMISLSLLRTLALVAVIASAGLHAASAPTISGNVNDAVDPAIKPGDDFYRYANGIWLRASAVPQGQPSYDNRAILTAKASKRVRELIQEAASSSPLQGSLAQKV